MNYLKVSENGHYFEKYGEPFFWLGDTIWPAVAWYSLEEMETYFKIRTEQGFNVIHIMLPWAMQGWMLAGRLDKEQTADLVSNQIPVFHNDNPDTPNEVYFEKLDKIIAMANDYDMYMTILPNGGNGGTHVEGEKILTKENIRRYGKWLGTRYKDASNIMWVNGFDIQPWLHVDLVYEFNAGIRESGSDHLLVYHPAGGGSSSYFHNEPWLDANFIQTWSYYDMIQRLVSFDYYRQPAKPVVMAEGAYEGGIEYPDGPIDSRLARAQGYWSYLSGGFYTYGHNDIWRKIKWRDAMDAKGAWQMKILKDFFTALEWWKLIPDQSVILSRSFARYTSEGHAMARADDGSYAVAYYAHKCTININLAKFSDGRPVRSKWMDPQNGQWLEGETYTAATAEIPSPAQFDDAILLLETL